MNFWDSVLIKKLSEKCLPGISRIVRCKELIILFYSPKIEIKLVKKQVGFPFNRYCFVKLTKMVRPQKSKCIRLFLVIVSLICHILGWFEFFKLSCRLDIRAKIGHWSELVTWFYGKIWSHSSKPNFQTSRPYLERGATFHSLRSCKRTRISLREILVCSTLNNSFLPHKLSFLQSAKLSFR